MKKTLLTALIVLVVLGMADSIYLAYAEITNAQLTCTISGLDGCNIVAQSAYSHIFGIPLGVYGIGFYGVILVLGIAMALIASRKVYLLNLLVAWFGLALSIVFVLEQVFLIKAICIYCMGSAAITFLICVVSNLLWSKCAPAKLVPVNIPQM